MPIKSRLITPEEADRLGIPRMTSVISGVSDSRIKGSPKSKTPPSQSGPQKTEPKQNS